MTVASVVGVQGCFFYPQLLTVDLMVRCRAPARCGRARGEAVCGGARKTLAGGHGVMET